MLENNGKLMSCGSRKCAMQSFFTRKFCNHVGVPDYLMLIIDLVYRIPTHVLLNRSFVA